MRGKLVLLHQQSLVQLTLVLLDLLLHVGDCSCNLKEMRRSVSRSFKDSSGWKGEENKKNALHVWLPKQEG